MTPMKDTKGKPIPDTAMPMHKKLAMGQDVQTGAGSGATGGKTKPSTKW